MWAMLLWTGCQGDPTACEAGFELRDDGLCYQDDAAPAPATLGDVFDGMEPCDLDPGDGRIDLETGCADGACGDMDYDEINDALGSTGACSTNTFDATLVSCTWDGGYAASFDDLDADGAPDAGSDAFTLTLDPPYRGTTDAGLGLSVGMRCFVGVLGDPGDVLYVRIDDEYLAFYMGWDGLTAYDFYSGEGQFGPDGVVDSISLYPPF